MLETMEVTVVYLGDIPPYCTHTVAYRHITHDCRDRAHPLTKGIVFKGEGGTLTFGAISMAPMQHIDPFIVTIDFLEQLFEGDNIQKFEQSPGNLSHATYPIAWQSV